MKIILSRKGFDSQYGGYPSPILPDGRPLSLPIPSGDARRFGDLRDHDGQSVHRKMAQLGMKWRARDRCHVDPDLVPWSLPRKEHWRPSFGQRGGAQGHLRRQGVGRGDLFLFFGSFRRTKSVGSSLRFDGGPQNDQHALFGWLQVDSLVLPKDESPSYLCDHPHNASPHRDDPNNCIYLARQRLSLDPKIPGAGILRYTDDTRLTKPGLSKSRWKLDQEVFGALPISYHSEKSWREGFFQSAAKGQEFVVDADRRAIQWVRRLIRENAILNV